MWEEVGRLAAQESLTILLTTHYLEEADELADRLTIVSQGKVVAEGTPNELKSRLIGDAVHVELADGRVEDARRVLERVEAPVETTLADGRTLISRVPDGGQALPGILAALSAEGIPVASVSVNRPSLDDVYLHYTGSRLRDGGPGPVKAARDTWYMIGRQARNLLREPIWIAILLVQPMVWLLLYGQLFKNVTRLGGFGTASYITFLAPAIVVMNAFFSASWSGMSMVFDIERKFVERFLATPASRLSLVLSQIVRSALTAAIQGVIILLVAAALGVRVHAGLAGWIVILLVAILVNAAFAGFSQGIALLVRRESTVIALANFISLPLLFLSSTLLAEAQMPHWMRVLSDFNPVNWGVRASRDVVLQGTDWGSVGTHLAYLFALSVVTAAFANWTFRVYKRSL
jgi:ABC-2 type transport system permease protein